MLKEKIQKLQNRAARDMTGDKYNVRSSDLLHAMSGKNLNDKQKMNKSERQTKNEQICPDFQI